MRIFLVGLTAGIFLVSVCVCCYIAGMGDGKRSVVDDCVQHRAFTYQENAWGCVRLRRTSRELTMDDLNGNQGV